MNKQLYSPLSPSSANVRAKAWIIVGMCAMSLMLTFWPPSSTPTTELISDNLTESSPSKYPGIVVETEKVEYFKATSRQSHTPFDLYVHDPGVDQWTSAEIGQNGIWHKEICHEVSTALEELRKTNGDNQLQVLDIGANVGYISFWAATTEDKNVRVTSIEPHPYHNSLLEKSLNLPVNAQVRRRINLHKVAVGTPDEAGTTLCMRINPSNAAQTIVDKASGEEMKEWPCTHVVVTTVDNLLADHPPIDILKMDVEGYENRALQGAKNSLMKHPPKLIIMEYNYWLLERASGFPPEKWIEELFDLGYHNITDLGTLKQMTTKEAVKEYFAKDAFLKAIPSSHTDLVLRFKQW